MKNNYNLWPDNVLHVYGTVKLQLLHLAGKLIQPCIASDGFLLYLLQLWTFNAIHKTTPVHITST